jgi:lipoteichoic acid synthase
VRRWKPGFQKDGLLLTRVLPISMLVLFLLGNSFKLTVFNLFLTGLSGKKLYFTVLWGFFSWAFTISGLFFLPAMRLKKPFVLTAIYVLQALFLVVNLTYYFFFESYLHLNQYFELWAETLELMKHRAVPFEPGLLVMFVDLPFFLYIVVAYRRILAFNRTAVFRYSTFVPAVLIVIAFGRWNILKEGTPLEIMNDRYMSEAQAVKKYGILTFDVMNLLKLRDNRKLISKLESGDKVRVAPDTTAVDTPNVVCIQVESMDAFIVKRMHKGKPVTPFLNALAKKSVYFPYVLSYHKAGSTSDCEFSCFNSAEPLDHFPSIKIRNYGFPNSAVRRFTAAGYEAAIFHGNKGDYFNRRIAFRKMGFPSFFDMHDMRLKEVCWGAPDGDVFNYMIGRMAETTKPFFYYAITMSSHEPFTFVKPYYSQKRFDNIQDTRARNYFTCMSYVDRELKRLVEWIHANHPCTYIVIYGDHAPGIKKGLYSQASFKYNDVFFEFVPMFIITPDRQVRHERRYTVSFLDVAPTILGATGRGFEIRTFGRDLLKQEYGSAAIPFRGQNYNRRLLYTMIEKQRKTTP